MFGTTSKRLAVVILVLAAAACSKTSTVSEEPGRIVLTADSKDDLTQATKQAEEYCAKTKMTAELDKTEEVNDGVVAYFTCH